MATGLSNLTDARDLLGMRHRGVWGSPGKVDTVSLIADLPMT